MEFEVRWLRRLIILLLGTAVTLILLIAAGVFDPRPVGELQWEQPLASQTIEAGSQPIVWLDLTTPPDGYSLRLQTAHQRGEMDLLYGLVIGDDEDYLVTAVSPLGYAALWEQHAASNVQHSAFQPWPHLRPGENEIWLDVVDGRATIHLNRELYWAGAVETGQGRIGLWLASFGETAVIDFPALQLYIR